MARRLDSAGAGFAAAFDALLDDRRGVAADVDRDTAAIVDAVRTGGDAALLDYTARFDRLTLTPDTIRLAADEAAALAAAAPEAVRDALGQAAARIEAFHARLMPGRSRLPRRGRRKAGRALAPAGCGRPLCPRRHRRLSKHGADERDPRAGRRRAPHRHGGAGAGRRAGPPPSWLPPRSQESPRSIGVGGAQAIAALAHGTETITPVDKIVGPGHAYVAAAKRLVFGIVGIDMIAGPSEILVVADNANEPDWIAADLLSQAEHDGDAQAILMTDDAAFAARVTDAVAAHLVELPAHRHRHRELAPSRRGQSCCVPSTRRRR